MLFICFYLFLVVAAVSRSIPVKPGETKPFTVGSHTTWYFASSLSPSLIFRQTHFSLLSRSSICRQTFNLQNRRKSTLLLLLAGDISTNPGPTLRPIKIACTNVQSIRKKAAPIASVVRDGRIDCLLVTETWLQETDTESHIKDLTPEGFNFLHQTRKTGTTIGSDARGGGVGCFTDERCKSSTVPSKPYSSFEHLITPVDFGKVKINIVTVYRPPGSPEFLDQLQDLLSDVTALQSSFILTGDLNMHLDVADNPETLKFNEILQNFNLKQHVTTSTHIQGHTLDVFITPEDCNYIVDMSVSDGISDHLLITATLSFKIPNTSNHTTSTFRPIKKINLPAFKSDLAESDLIKNPATTASSLYNQYHSVMAGLLDRHAPTRTRSFPSRPRDPWINEGILEAKREKRRLERVWRRTGLASDRKRYSTQVHHYNRLLSHSKGDWYSQMIDENKDDPRKLWNSINRILHRNEASPLPDCSDKADLANSFGTYFKDKITKIRTAFSLDDPTAQSKPDYTPPPLTAFTPATEEEVRKLISSSPNKSCDLDPCPTSLVKDCIDLLVTPITNIINLSLSEGIFPDCFKQALISPLLKKPSLPKNEFKNYRPVSNLNFISKIMEKVVASQIKSHVDRFGLDNEFQSAYKSFHSTETALLSVQNDIYEAMGKGEVTALTLLDLSAAFDTIDHRILLDRLADWFGITKGALKWLVSYLKNRSQSINIQGNVSIPITLLFGVPQGSVLGPLLFILYTTPLSKILSSAKDIKHHLYADDTQAYTSFNITTFKTYIKQLQNCLVSVKEWMYHNLLKLNPDKTEFLLIGNKCHREKFVSEFPIDILGNPLSPSDSARNLGVTFDADFSFKRHINNTVSSCYYYIRDIRRIRKHLNLNAATALANALVSSRLDYCNSLLYSVPACYIRKLERVQNSLARVVTLSPKFSHTSPLLKQLHWLPVKSRIHFKVALLTHKAIHSKQPPSLAKHISVRTLDKNLKSQSGNFLNYSSALAGFGLKAFKSFAPVVWNKIPSVIRSINSVAAFRKTLKTHYFAHPPKHRSHNT